MGAHVNSRPSLTLNHGMDALVSSEKLATVSDQRSSLCFCPFLPIAPRAPAFAEGVYSCRGTYRFTRYTYFPAVRNHRPR